MASSLVRENWAPVVKIELLEKVTWLLQRQGLLLAAPHLAAEKRQALPMLRQMHSAEPTAP
jgi:hypothetical protein